MFDMNQTITHTIFFLPTTVIKLAVQMKQIILSFLGLVINTIAKRDSEGTYTLLLTLGAHAQRGLQ